MTPGRQNVGNADVELKYFYGIDPFDAYAGIAQDSEGFSRF